MYMRTLSVKGRPHHKMWPAIARHPQRLVASGTAPVFGRIGAATDRFSTAPSSTDDGANAAVKGSKSSWRGAATLTFSARIHRPP